MGQGFARRGGADDLAATGDPGARGGATEPSPARGATGASGVAPGTTSLPPDSTSIAPETQTRAPAEWLDRLLRASNELAPSSSLREAAERVLAAAAPSVEGHALGVCAPDGRGGSMVVRLGGAPEADHPARLFPSWARETVHAIPLDEGSTLHVASVEDDGGDMPPVLLDRLLATLGASLRRARAAEIAGRGAASVQKLEDQMIHAERLAGLGQIAAGIVHDLNTPLTTVVAYADVLLKKWGAASGVDEADRLRLLRIHEAAERLLGFSRDLMAYSRPSPHIPGPVDIHEVMDRALAFCEHAVATSRAVVERDYGEVRAVRGVAGQLIQVFVNLITNACQAVLPDGTGRISLTVRSAGEHVLVTVADDGAGLPSEVDRLFEPFFTTKEGGTGLGLAIVGKIVAAHGGKVQALQRAPRGTSFLVTLPLAASGSDPAP